MRGRLGISVVALYALAALAGVALAGAPDAAALTRGQADAIALRVLKPQQAAAGTRVVLFGLPRPVRAGRAVFDLSPPARGRLVRRRVKTLRHPAWLYWEDLVYGAEFQHPSRLLLVDDRSGRVLRRQAEQWWPVIDGVRPAFLTAAGYGDPRYQVYTNVAQPPAAAPAAGAAARAFGPRTAGWPAHVAQQAPAPAPVAAARDSLKGDCLITIGHQGDPRTKPGFAGIEGLAGRLSAAGTGLQTFDADKLAPTKYEQDGANGSDLAKLVGSVIKNNGCTDIFIYLAGHGSRTGPASVNTGFQWHDLGATNAKGDALLTGTPSYVRSDDIKSILLAHPSIDFKLKVDSCFSGRFILDLPKEEHPNLLIAESSSNAEEYSYFSIPAIVDAAGKTIYSKTNNPGNKILQVDDPQHPGKKKSVWDETAGRMEFTNGNLAALETFFTSSDLIGQATGQGGPLMARALDYAAAHEGDQDFASQQQMTHPRVQVNISAAVVKYGSTLKAQAASLVKGIAADVAYWIAGINQGLSRAHVAQAGGVLATGAAPADGTVTQITVKGYAINGDRPGPGGSEPIRFSVARPQPNGQLKVITTTDPPFTLPGTDGVWTFDMSQVRFKCCNVQKGDIVSLDARGGEFAVFGQVPGSVTDVFTMAGPTQDPGYMWTGTPHQDVELLMQVTERVH